jgi:hypothetical protein
MLRRSSAYNANLLPSVHLNTRQPMKKKAIPGTGRLSKHSRPCAAPLNEHSARAKDLFFFAQATHKAAKKLAGTPQIDSNPLGELDAYPVLFMYRHAAELFLKAILGEGGNFLLNKPDPISVSKTRSVSWLAQFVVQIVTTLKWEEQFRCDGVENFAEFKKLLDEVNGVDLGHGMFRNSGDVATSLPEFFRRMDALLDLLESTADGLAAEWDLRNEAGVEEK